MVGRFDDHFVRADTVHAIEKAFSLAVEPSLNSQSGKFIGHDAQGPAGRVSSAPVSAICQYFRRSFSLVPRAERAQPNAFDLHALANENPWAASRDRWK